MPLTSTKLQILLSLDVVTQRRCLPKMKCPVRHFIFCSKISVKFNFTVQKTIAILRIFRFLGKLKKRSIIWSLFFIVLIIRHQQTSLCIIIRQHIRIHSPVSILDFFYQLILLQFFLENKIKFYRYFAIKLQYV